MLHIDSITTHVGTGLSLYHDQNGLDQDTCGFDHDICELDHDTHGLDHDVDGQVPLVTVH